MRAFHRSLGFRLLVVSFVLLSLPLLVDSFLLIQKGYKRTLTDAKQLLMSTSQLRELPISTIQPINSSLLAVLSYFLQLHDQFPQEATPELTEKLQTIAKIGGFSGVFLIDITKDQHYVVTVSNLPNLVGHDYTSFLQQPNAISSRYSTSLSRTYLSFDPISLQPFCMVTYTVHSKETKKPIGMLAILDDIYQKVTPLLQPVQTPYPIHFAILLNSSMVIAASDKDLVFQHLKPFDINNIPVFLEGLPQLQALIPEESLPSSYFPNEPFLEFLWQGRKQIGYIHTIPGTTLLFLTYAGRKAIFLTPAVQIFNIYSVYLMILAIGGTAAYFITKRLTRPMQTLCGTMEAIQQGHLEKRYQEDPLGFEINGLGAIFNSMVDNALAQQRYAEAQRIDRERYAHELALGREVQANLLPRQMPSYPGVDLASLYIPAIQVGGDFYDLFIKTRPDASPQLVLTIADTSGKGVQACFYSFIVRHLLHTYTQEYEDVGAAVSLTNKVFQLDTRDTGMFVTAFVSIYDGDSHLLHYFSAGHNPPLIRKADGTLLRLEKHGIAMGVFPSEGEKEEIVPLEPGDLLVLYTDGITETFNAESQLFGEERLMALLREKSFSSAQEGVDAIIKAVRLFAGTTPQHDDITLLVMKVL